jgi:hypothetical protein
MQGTIANGSGFDWWNNEAPGSYVTESSLGGLEIKAVQTGSGSVEAAY